MNDPQKPPQKTPSPQYSRCCCNKCFALVDMRWIEWGKVKACPNCKTKFVLVGNEWVCEGQQGALL